MPKISKSRIINIKYNDDRRTIYDEIFDFKNGSNVLFSMDNGIGKTVLIQFLMQPFLNDGFYRKLGERPFQDYFNTNAPTIVMNEIKMDEGGEYFLIGMLIKADKDVEGVRKLKYLAFTNSYSSPSDYDIENIPFVVVENERKRIISFNEGETMLKNAQKELRDFKVYNFNETSQKAEYFKKLAEHRLSYKEWESLIRKINMQEAGLIQLYKDSTTSETLLKNNILPVIEEKLNDDKDILGELRDNLKKYIYKYVGQKHIIDKLQGFESFIIDAKKITPEFEKYKIELVEFKKTENTLASLYRYVLTKINEINDEFEVYNNCIVKVDIEIRQIAIEKLSYNIQLKMKELDNIIEKIDEMNKKSSNLKAKECLFEKNIAIQKCAQNYFYLMGKRKELSEIMERIVNAEKDDNEIQIKIKDYRFTLRKLYDDKLSKVEDIINATKLNITSCENNLTKVESNLEINNNSKNDITLKIRSNEYIIQEFVRKDEVFISSYNDFKFEKNFFGAYDEKDLTSYDKDIKVNIDDLSSNLVNSKNTNITLKKEIELLDIERSNTRNTNYELKLKLTGKEKELEVFNKFTKEINLILKGNELSEDILKNKDKLIERITDNNIKYKTEKELLQKNEFLAETKLNNLENCSLLDIPSDFKKLLEDSGIGIKRGLQRLKERKDSFEEKLELIKKNPFLPYSLLMSREEINILSKLKINTSIPIPIVDENNLNEQIQIAGVNNLYSTSSMNFYISFSEDLLDENKLNEKIKKLKSILNTQKNEIESIDLTMDNLKRQLNIINNYAYKGNEDVVIISDINKLEVEIKLQDDRILNMSSLVKNKKDKTELLNNEILNISGEITKQLEKSRKFLEFREIYTKSENSKSENIKYKDELKTLLSTEEILAREISNLRNDKENEKIKLSQIKADRKLVETELSKYENAIAGTIIGREISDIEAALKACEQHYNVDLKRDKELEKGLRTDIKQYESNIDRDSKVGQNSKIAKLTVVDYRDIKYDKDTYDLYIKKLSAIEEQLNILKDSLLENEKVKAVLVDNLKQLRENLHKCGVEEIIPLEQIKNIKFEARESNQNKLRSEYTSKKDLLKEQQFTLNIEINKLQKFENVSLSDEVISQIDKEDIKQMSKENMEKYDKEFSLLEETKENIKTELNAIYSKYKDTHEIFKLHLNHLSKEHKPIKIEKGIKLLVDILEKQINAENTIRQNLDELRNTIVNEIESYGESIYDELSTIDENSAIYVKNIRKKMLQIIIPSKEDLNKEAINIYVKSVIETITQDESLNDIDVQLMSQINSEKLLEQLVGGLKRITIKIYKIEKFAMHLKNWEEINHKNSGAERFVSVFIVFTALLSYLRRKQGDYLKNAKEGMIMIMDNPFANTNAEYLLVPMFDIAKKYNVQLIFFSGITGSAILNRFDTIYIAKVMKDKYSQNEKVGFTDLSNTSIDKDTLEISKMEYEKVEQQTVF